MHDPETPETLIRAFHFPWPLVGTRKVTLRGRQLTLRVPWFLSKQPSYERPLLFSLWHKDPCHGHEDDSCDWAFPRSSPADHRIIDRLVKEDAGASLFFGSDAVMKEARVRNPTYQYLELSPGATLGYVIGAWHLIKCAKRGRYSPLSGGEMSEIMLLACNPHDNVASTLVGSSDRQQRVSRFLHCVMRCYNHHHRPWYWHPRYHVHHWHLSCDVCRRVRNALRRCAVCGQRFGIRRLPVHVGTERDAQGEPRPRLCHDTCAYTPDSTRRLTPANQDNWNAA